MDSSALSTAVRQQAHSAARIKCALLGWALACVVAGCHTVAPHKPPVVPAVSTACRQDPISVPAFYVARRPRVASSDFTNSGEARSAEEILAAAQAHERAGRECCVEFYYQAAVLTLPSRGGCGPTNGSLARPQQLQTHRAAMAGFLMSAQQFRRYSPQSGIRVNSANGPVLVSIEHHGFAWRPYDFHELRLASEYRGSDLRRHFFAPGVGVSLVVVRKSRCEELFFAPDHPFAATAVLQPATTASNPFPANSQPPTGVRLAFYNPLVYDGVRVANLNMPLERDLSAPIAYADALGKRNWLTGFLDPFDPASKPKLTMLEPYQRGKTPVVFIHGLLSEPMAWADLLNELRASSEIHSQFQFWAYRYPTGSGFLDAAASLRELLQLARHSSDPAHADRSLDQMVLVGHSMGGLVARTQITESGDIAWRHFASQPIESIRAPPQELERLRRLFFFEPSPSVTRVVLIGTPHRGSSWSQRVVGRVGTSLVRFSSDEERRYQNLINANRDIILPRFQRAQPTSIELLDPESPLLAAIAQMPVKHDVQIHSIVGARRRTLAGEPTDGVVAASSAHYPCATSELWVAASHSDLHHDPTTIAEVRRILLEHALATRRNACDPQVDDAACRLSPAP